MLRNECKLLASQRFLQTKRLAGLAFLSAVLLFASCDSTKKDGSTGGKTAGDATTEVNNTLSGTIKIEGSSTVGPISSKAREEFNKKFPKVNISVGEQGTSNGFSSFGKKETDISDASRPIKDKELAACNEAGIEFYEMPIAYDGLTFVVNKENDFCKELTIDQLIAIFRQDTAAKTWKDVHPDWPDEKIALFIPGIQSGTHDYCVEVLGKKDNQGLRADATQSEDDKTLVTGVKGDKYAIGFFGYSYYEASKDELNAVAIVNTSGVAVPPSVSAIEDGTYEPFSRPLFIYVNKDSFQRAEVEEFVSFYLDNIVDIVKASDYVPLPQKMYDLVRKTLDDDQVGTHYYDATGKKNEGSLDQIFSGPAVSKPKAE